MSPDPAMTPSSSDPASGTPDARRLLAFYEELADEIGRGERPDLARHVARRPEFAEEVAAAVLAELRGLEAPTEGPPTDAGAPTRLGPYLLGREIGRGGQATVYEAEDPRLGRTVALKVYADLGPGAEAVLRRFRREAAAASRIDHPAICPVYDAGVAGGAAYIAMRLVPGETLAARLARERRESRTSRTKPDRARVDALLALFEQTARALHAAHEAGVVHRDVKPANLMIGPGGEPTLLDFGLAAADDGGPALTRTGDVFGTPAYMAPEQLKPDGAVGPAADVWGLGAALFEAFALRPPFEGASRQALAAAILEQDPDDLRRAAPDAPPDLAAVVGAALEKDPRRRYRTAAAFADDLRRVRAGEPPEAKPVSFAGRWMRRARRRPLTAALVVATVVAVPALGALAGVVYASRDDVAAAADLRRRRAFEDALEAGFGAMADREFDAATAWFRRAEEVDPSAIEPLGGRAFALFSAQRFEDQRALLADHPATPRSPALRQLLAAALQNLGRTDDPAAAAPRDESDDPFNRFVRSYLLLVGARGPQAAARARGAMHEAWRGVALAPEPRSIYFHQLGLAAATAGDAAVARTAVAGMRRHWPDNPQTAHMAGHALETFSPAEALAAFQDALRLRPNWIEALRDVAKTAPEAGRYDAQLAARAELRRRLPRDAEAASQYGYALMIAGDLAESLAQYDAAVALEPAAPQYRQNRATALRKLGRSAEAAAEYARTVEAHPRFVRSRIDSAVALRESGRYAEALAELDRAEKDAAEQGMAAQWRDWRADSARLSAHAARIDALAADPDGAEELAFAELEPTARLATLAGYLRLSAALYGMSLDESPPAPKTSDPRRASFLRAAVQAASGVGRDAPPAAADRAALRAVALRRLEEEAEAFEAAAAAPAPPHAKLREMTVYLLTYVDLAAARGFPRDPALTPEERAAWGAVWERVVKVRRELPPP